MTYFSPTCASCWVFILCTAIFSLSYSSTESTSKIDSLKTDSSANLNQGFIVCNSSGSLNCQFLLNYLHKNEYILTVP